MRGIVIALHDMEEVVNQSTVNYCWTFVFKLNNSLYYTTYIHKVCVYQVYIPVNVQKEVIIIPIQNEYFT